MDDDSAGDLQYDELVRVLEQAVDLGLREVKICGAGEPTEDPMLLPFVRRMNASGVGVGVFTKGHVLGSDRAVERIFGRYGVQSARDLAAAFAELDVSFFLSWQSFHAPIQDELVSHPGYTVLRNQALANLVDAGFAGDQPSRLALVNAPVLRSNYDEAFAIYVFARRLGLYPVTAMLMTSGRRITPTTRDDLDPTDDQKRVLWHRTYDWNLANGLQTAADLVRQGVSAMPGSHPCNQLAAGLYVTANGNVVSCPGSSAVIGNVRDEPLRGIWHRSWNRRVFCGRENCGCPPKVGNTIPTDIGALMQPTPKTETSLQSWLAGGSLGAFKSTARV